MWTCQNCKTPIQDDAKEFCFECMTPRKTEYPQTNPKNLNQNMMEQTRTMYSNESNKSSFSAIQGYILIGLVCALIGLVAWSLLKPAPKYAYKILNVQAQFNTKPESTTGGLSQLNKAELGATSVNLKDEDLSILGSEGWELVESFLEIETTHPNYGNSEYVTGLQPNVRPQRVVMIFRKPL